MSKHKARGYVAYYVFYFFDRYVRTLTYAILTYVNNLSLQDAEPFVRFPGNIVKQVKVHALCYKALRHFIVGILRMFWQ